MGHTPGPWTAGGASGNEGEAREIASADRCIAWTASTWDDDEGDVVTEEDAANANLIAAAPELLAALKELVDYDGGSSEPESYGYEVLLRCKAAIARAEGRSE